MNTKAFVMLVEVVIIYKFTHSNVTSLDSLANHTENKCVQEMIFIKCISSTTVCTYSVSANKYG